MEHWEAKEQLEWYFQEAAGDAGLRSPFGYQLDRCEAGVLFGGAEPKTDDGMVVKLAKRTDRCSIHERLCRTSHSHQAVLRAAYGDIVLVAPTDVSVSLACMTEVFAKCHAASSARTRHGAPLSPREYLNDVITQAGGKPESKFAELLSTILEQAEAMRSEALDAYCAANPRCEVLAA